MTAAERWRKLESCQQPIEVAMVLRVAGVKGRRCGIGTCPIARWVGGADDSDSAEVDGGEVRAWGPSGRVLSESYQENGPIGAFIFRFDQEGCYADLAEAAR